MPSHLPTQVTPVERSHGCSRRSGQNRSGRSSPSATAMVTMNDVIAEPLAKTTPVREEMSRAEQKVDKRAKSTDAIEDDAEALPAGGWVTGRGR